MPPPHRGIFGRGDIRDRVQSLKYQILFKRYNVIIVYYKSLFL